jgi:hypothetical protein
MFMFVLVGAMLVSLSSDAAPKPKKPRPRQKDGSYTLAVAGVVTGEGNGTISGEQLTLDAAVAADGGAAGKLTAVLKLSQNHFDGPGTVMGQAATFKGRVDQPDDLTERAIKGVRLTCTFKTANGEYGRIIGNLPTAPRATTGSSDGNGGGGRGRGRSGDE